MSDVSENIQTVSAFGKKAKVKTTGGGLMAFGIIGALATVLAAALVLTSMGS